MSHGSGVFVSGAYCFKPAKSSVACLATSAMHVPHPDLPRPTALELIKFLDVSHPVGVRKIVSPVGSVRRSHLPCYDTYVQFKKDYPTFVVLVKVSPTPLLLGWLCGHISDVLCVKQGQDVRSMTGVHE